MSLPPGPRHAPAYQMWNWVRRPTEYLDELEQQHGETLRLHFMGVQPFVLFSNPEHLQQIFSATAEELHGGRANVTLKPFLGAHSLLMLDEEEHHRQRRIILGALHGERMQEYGEQMAQLTHAMVDRWPVGTAFPVHPSFQETTLLIILRTVLGLESPERLATFAAAVGEFIHLATWPWLLFTPMRVDLGAWSPWGRFRRSLARVHALFHEEIRLRHEQGSAGRSDILSLLMEGRDEEGQPLSDAELSDQLLTLLVSGHETTAAALAWFWNWVLQDAEIYTALKEEVRGAGVSAERGAKLPLLDAAIKETLRLQPVLPTLGRVVNQPLRIGGYELPVDSRLMVSIYLTHRRPSLYPDPTRFRPQRFLERKFALWEWIPFGGGTRRCVGMHFSLYEMRIVLASILARTELRPAPGPPIHVERRGITMGTSRGMPLIVERRWERNAVGRAA